MHENWHTREGERHTSGEKDSVNDVDDTNAGLHIDGDHLSAWVHAHGCDVDRLAVLHQNIFTLEPLVWVVVGGVGSLPGGLNLICVAQGQYMKSREALIVDHLLRVISYTIQNVVVACGGTWGVRCLP